MATKSLSWLSGLKLVALKHVAVATGVNSSGTKTALIDRIASELQIHAENKAKTTKDGPTAKGNGFRAPQKVVSIDMGIRNLAYCVLSVAKGGGDATAAPGTATRHAGKRSGHNKPGLPVVEHWTRLGVSARAKDRVEPGTEDGANDTGTVNSKGKGKGKSKVKEAFDPATFARHAYVLVSGLLATHRPAVVLVERQRYRSMGASAVQEWTLRVNMFEAMIHAVLETLAKEERWHGRVHAVSPGKVGPFWLESEAKSIGEPTAASAAGKLKNKMAKIDLVGKWLDDGCGVVMQGQAKAMAEAFRTKWSGSRRNVGRTGKKATQGRSEAPTASEDLGKLDDLADSLLQGVAWLKWQENKSLLLERGLDALEESRIR